MELRLELHTQVPDKNSALTVRFFCVECAFYQRFFCVFFCFLNIIGLPPKKVIQHVPRTINPVIDSPMKKCMKLSNDRTLFTGVFGNEKVREKDN